MVMTKLEIKIDKQKAIMSGVKSGAYLATHDKEDDRIIFFDHRMSNTVTVINKLYSGSFHMQEGQQAGLYTNLKKIKKITIEVELE